ncbi:UDP-2,3-diacylglucosamine diphosphatase [Raineya sp.]|jgi:UDP-2,3-diacylglucosamine hydrolase
MPDFSTNITLQAGKKVYFASDFHLGVRNSHEREQKICDFLEQISHDAQIIFLLGDIFDFWFEYKHAIPKGFIRFQAKLIEILDRNIPIVFFTGNHDMWLFDYFTKELGIPIFRNPIEISINQKTFLIGHGDGLGPGDTKYKILKKIFANKLCQWLFRQIHPDWGIALAQFWSKHSRLQSEKKGAEKFLGDDEWLWTYCKEQEALKHRDYYIFGHRHLPLFLSVGKNAHYINIGEWIYHCTYATFDGENVELLTWQKTEKWQNVMV